MNYETTTAAFFDSIYRRSSDPWNFQQSSYEQQRYGVLIEALKGSIYQRAFEPGCSIGILTELLAPLCMKLEATDISSVAVSLARERCKDLGNVTIRGGSLLDSVPEGMFDLIVFSEIGYYFDEIGLQSIVERLIERLLPKGILLAAHWLGVSKDHVLSGDHVHTVVRAAERLALVEEKRYPAFRLDRLERV